MEQKLRNHAVLWDMDGVLVDTGEFHFRAWKKTFEEASVPFTRDDFRETFGMNNAGILEWMYDRKPDPSEVARVSNRKESLFRELIQGKAKPLPGILDWLKQFQDWEVKQAITSSAPPENIQALVSELEIESYFDAIVSGFDLPGKPNPDVYLKAARILQVPTDNCIVVEDAIAGVEGANRAGMKCIAVTTTNPADKLSKADHVFENLAQMSKAELLSILD